MTATIQKSSKEGKNQNEFKITAEEGAFEFLPDDVITIEQQELSFWNQLTGSVSYGFSFAGGNSNTLNSSLGADVAFNTEKNSIRLATSSNLTPKPMPRTQAVSPSTRNMDGRLQGNGLQLDF